MDCSEPCIHSTPRPRLFSERPFYMLIETKDPVIGSLILSSRNHSNMGRTCCASSSGGSMSRRIRAFGKELMRFKLLKLSQLILVIYIAAFSFGPWGLRDQETGYFVDPDSDEETEAGLIDVHGSERAIVATSKFQVACLALARLSAWFMYPSKCNTPFARFLFVFLSRMKSSYKSLINVSFGICLCVQVSCHDDIFEQDTLGHVHVSRFA